MQLNLFEDKRSVQPFRKQLLKWVGNKQRFAHEIISYFPIKFNRYFEPFLGSGAVLGTLTPSNAIASDVFKPLIEIWTTLKTEPEDLKGWYSERWHQMMQGEKVAVYEKIKASYNFSPNGADLLFLSRSCYGGVVRFRQADGYMSTPCGPHTPISPESFAQRVDIWHKRVQDTKFLNVEYEEAMIQAKEGDLIYCDPPYSDSQAILYGAQSFDLEHLLDLIKHLKKRGVFVALSIDGTKHSGKKKISLPIPPGVFENQVYVNVGKSMLKRLQMNGKTLEGEEVKDRLLLTY